MGVGVLSAGRALSRREGGRGTIRAPSMVVGAGGVIAPGVATGPAPKKTLYRPLDTASVPVVGATSVVVAPGSTSFLSEHGSCPGLATMAVGTPVGVSRSNPADKSAFYSYCSTGVDMEAYYNVNSSKASSPAIVTVTYNSLEGTVVGAGPGLGDAL